VRLSKKVSSPHVENVVNPPSRPTNKQAHKEELPPVKAQGVAPRNKQSSE
jgi:hypothetical protein